MLLRAWWGSGRRRWRRGERNRLLLYILIIRAKGACCEGARGGRPNLRHTIIAWKSAINIRIWLTHIEPDESYIQCIEHRNCNLFWEIYGLINKTSSKTFWICRSSKKWSCWSETLRRRSLMSFWVGILNEESSHRRDNFLLCFLLL